MAAGCTLTYIYTVVRMISLERRVLDIYHWNADTDHGAYRYTHGPVMHQLGCIGL